MRGILTGLVWLACASLAQAGAWPREEGKAFVAVSTLFSTPATEFPLPTMGLRSRASVFAEYGLGQEWTVGLDGSYNMGTDGGVSSALVFARKPVWRTEGGHIFAAELGVGAILDETEGTVARLRPSASWGKGYESAWGGGWMGVESSLEVNAPSNGVTLKLDATLGIRPWEGWFLIAQVQTYHKVGEVTILKLAPSAAYQIGARSHIQLGLEWAVTGDDSIGFKFANWYSF